MEMETFRHSAEPESVLLLQQHFRFRWLQTEPTHHVRLLVCVCLPVEGLPAARFTKQPPQGLALEPLISTTTGLEMLTRAKPGNSICVSFLFFLFLIFPFQPFFSLLAAKGFRKGYNDGVERTQGERCVSNCDDLFSLRITLFGRTHSQYIVVPSNSVANVVAVAEGRPHHGAFTFDAGQVYGLWFGTLLLLTLWSGADAVNYRLHSCFITF